MKDCPVCGGPKHPGATYCSRDCQQIYHKQYVDPLIRERERLGTDHMDDMLANDAQTESTDMLDIEGDTQ